MQYGVDLTIWAHEHSYERMFPLYNRQVYNGSADEPYRNPKGLVHLTTGSAVGFLHQHQYHYARTITRVIPTVIIFEFKKFLLRTALLSGMQREA